MKQIVFFLQTIWLVASSWACYHISTFITQYFLLRILIGTIIWIPLYWTGLSLLSLLDSDNRLAAKLNLKIEYLPIYKDFYKRWRQALLMGDRAKYIALVEEMQHLPDPEGYQRYFLYQCQKIVREQQKKDDEK